MEVRKIAFAHVEPHDGLLYVGKDVGRVGLRAERASEEVGKEEPHGIFAGVVGQRGVEVEAAGCLWACQSLLGAFVPRDFQHC